MKNPGTEKIGALAGGGDCPGLNAVIRGVVRAAAGRGWESMGFPDGYGGLLAPVSYRRPEANGIDGTMPRSTGISVGDR